MDTPPSVVRRLLKLGYDTAPRPRHPRTVPSPHPSWAFDVTVIVLCAAGVVLYFTT